MEHDYGTACVIHSLLLSLPQFHSKPVVDCKHYNTTYNILNLGTK
jgi:hypothetical protein